MEGNASDDPASLAADQPAPDVHDRTSASVRLVAAIAASWVAAGVVGLVLALTLPVTTDDGFAVDADLFGVTRGQATEIECTVLGGGFQHEGEAFDEAKDEACSIATSDRWTIVTAVAFLSGLGGVALSLATRRSRNQFHGWTRTARRLSAVGGLTLLVLSLPLIGLALLVRAWTPKPNELPVELALPLSDASLDVVLSFDTMDSPSTSLEDSPPSTTRYILVTRTSALDQTSLMDDIAALLRRQGFDLDPASELKSGTWSAYWSPPVEVGTVDAFVESESGGRAWDHDDMAQLLNRAASRADTPVVLVVASTL